ncbi:MAG: JAB domain-containing protein [Bdellovibrionales bacterium]|nr:JAB domain-containing protein [Bdellovibrionales bacterium]
MRITHPYLLWRHLRRVMNPEVEEFWASALNSHKELIRSACIFRGSVDCCFVHPRDVFRFALQNNASSMILAHNHPSQCAEPSPEDLKIHRNFLKAARVLQIPIIDHLIVTDTKYFSFCEKKLMLG